MDSMNPPDLGTASPVDSPPSRDASTSRISSRRASVEAARRFVRQLRRSSGEGLDTDDPAAVCDVSLRARAVLSRDCDDEESGQKNERDLDDPNLFRQQRERYWIDMLDDSSSESDDDITAARGRRTVEEAVRVVARIRPNSDELKTIHKVNDKMLSFARNPPTPQPKLCGFDHVFGPSSTNEEVCSDICGSVVSKAMGGYNAAVMCYGNTGSGKTYTMLGGDGQPGILGTLATKLWSELRHLDGHTVHLSIVEVYNETLRTLVGPKAGSTVRMYNVPAVAVEDAVDFLTVSTAALRLRQTHSTNFNLTSSRSHVVAIVNLCARARMDGSLVKSSIFLCDLAGSENAVAASDHVDRVREGCFINRSLLALKLVIHAVAMRKPFIPHRSSVLTTLLRHAFGGSAVTTLVLCLSPSVDHSEHTVSSLNFAEDAKKITNVARQNVYKTPAQLAAMVKARDAEIVVLQQQLKRLRRFVRNSLGVSVEDVMSSAGALQGTLQGCGPHELMEALDVAPTAATNSGRPVSPSAVEPFEEESARPNSARGGNSSSSRSFEEAAAARLLLHRAQCHAAAVLGGAHKLATQPQAAACVCGTPFSVTVKALKQRMTSASVSAGLLEGSAGSGSASRARDRGASAHTCAPLHWVILSKIFEFLSPLDVVRCRAVSPLWLDVAMGHPALARYWNRLLDYHGATPAEASDLLAKHPPAAAFFSFVRDKLAARATVNNPLNAESVTVDEPLPQQPNMLHAAEVLHVDERPARRLVDPSTLVTGGRAR